MDIDTDIHDSSMDILVYTTDIHKDSSTLVWRQNKKKVLATDYERLDNVSILTSHKAGRS